MAQSPRPPELSANLRWNWRTPAATTAILTAHAVLLHLMGHIPWCICGFAIWTSHAWSADTSQDLLDPYSFTHIIHGMLLYCLLRYAMRRQQIGQRFIVALLIEVGWELLENSPIVIERYRTATASLNYNGDSILNSLGDILSCLTGFWLASRLPVKVSIAAVLVIEFGLLLTIRDNLTLNVLTLFHKMPTVEKWQMGHGG